MNRIEKTEETVRALYGQEASPLRAAAPAPLRRGGEKMIVWQLILYCLLLTGMVKLAVRGGAVDGLFFYPRSVQERAVELGLSDEKTIRRRFKRFMTIFYAGMAAALVLIVGLWNRAADFWSAYWQSLLFLEVMNWYDGIVIDELWVGRSGFWVIPELADMPYVQTWPQMLRKRALLSLVWVAGAALTAGLAVLLF